MVVFNDDLEWLQFLGEQVRQARLRDNITQAELAKRCGVSLPTIGSLEKGEAVSLQTFVRVVQALGQENWLRSFAPTVAVSPVQRWQDAGKKRQRARSPQQ